MKFGKTEIPGALFKLARDRMLAGGAFTPVDIRDHLLREAEATLDTISDIRTNQWIIANRITRTCIAELRKTGEIVQLRRGTWSRVS